MNRIDRVVLESAPVKALRDALECGHDRIEVRNKQGESVAQCLECGQALWPMGEFDATAKPFDWALWRLTQSRAKAAREQLGWNESTFSTLYHAAYNDYLESPEWRGLRDKVLNRADGRCECCQIEMATEIHHSTYRRVGNESLADLVALCRACHARQHNLH